jgi:hypothetical protein
LPDEPADDIVKEPVVRHPVARLSILFVFVPIIVVDLPANFASWARRRVNVAIRLSCTNRRKQLWKVIPFKLL